MRYKSEKHRKAVMAAIFGKQGAATRARREKVETRVGAARQKITQKFYRALKKRGHIPHPNELVLGQRVYYLRTDPKTKTAGTKKERWITGRVVKRAIVGRRIVVAHIQWPKDVKLPKVLDTEAFKRLSIMVTGGTKVRKSPEARRAEQAIAEANKGLRVRHAEEAQRQGQKETERKVRLKHRWVLAVWAATQPSKRFQKDGKFTFSTAVERSEKLKAAARVIFGSPISSEMQADWHRNIQRKRRALYMRKYRKRKKSGV